VWVRVTVVLDDDGVVDVVVLVSVVTGVVSTGAGVTGAVVVVVVVGWASCARAEVEDSARTAIAAVALKRAGVVLIMSRNPPRLRLMRGCRRPAASLRQAVAEPY
jgi:hypothetical protein